ncbi:MAG: hypothetical protein Q4P13_05595, partial [Psychrobacter sp.]|nr:hypothetical protein [Psychrobacter sp.]
SRIQIDISNEGENPSESAVNNFFGSGEVIKIPSSCDEDEATWGDASYQFTKSKSKPVFIRYQSSWGASGSGGVTITVANDLLELNDYDDCYDNETLEKWDTN